MNYNFLYGLFQEEGDGWLNDIYIYLVNYFLKSCFGILCNTQQFSMQSNWVYEQDMSHGMHFGIHVSTYDCAVHQNEHMIRKGEYVVHMIK